jgi:hypothetical protein
MVFVSGRLWQREGVTGAAEKQRGLMIVAERVEFFSEPVGHIREIAEAFIDTPALVPRGRRPGPGPRGRSARAGRMSAQAATEQRRYLWRVALVCRFLGPLEPAAQG